MNFNNKREINITKILFLIYIFLLIWIILFKTSFSIYDFINLSRIRKINLIPFYYSTKVPFHLKEVIANILIFIPLGIYLKILGNSSKKVILYGFGFSMLLELIQFILKLGVTDITDVITNLSGTTIGVIIYILLKKIFKNEEKINKILSIIASIITILFFLLIIFLIIVN